MQTRIAQGIFGLWVLSPSQCEDREMLLVLHAATAAAQLKVVVCHVTVLRHPRPASIPLLCFVCLVSFIDTACVESLVRRRRALPSSSLMRSDYPATRSFTPCMMVVTS